MLETRDGGDLVRKGLKLSHLRILAALTETGQIGLAATRLGIAQPAASRLLAEVERIAGQAVHVRTGRGVALTPVGTALGQRALRITMELHDAARELDEIAAGGRGHVRIGSVTGPTMEYVLPALRTSRLAVPNVTTEVIVGTSDILCQDLLSGRIDFAIGRLAGDFDHRLLAIEILDTEPVSLVVRKGHRLAQAPAVAPSELMAYDWVMPRPESLLARTVVTRLRALGLPDPSQQLYTASFLLTLALLQQSNAIAPVAHAVAVSFTASPDAPYAILPVDLGIEVEAFGIVTRNGTEVTPAARQILDLIRNAAKRPVPVPAA